MRGDIEVSRDSYRRPGFRDLAGRAVVTATVAVGVNLVCTLSVWNVLPGLFLVYASTVASLMSGRTATERT